MIEASGGPTVRNVVDLTFFGAKAPEAKVDPRDHREQMRDRIEMIENYLRPLYKLPPGQLDSNYLDDLLKKFRRVASSLPEGNAKERIKHDEGLLLLLERRISDYRASLVPRSMVIVLILLGMISAGGILLPLWMLPGQPGSISKTATLGTLGAGMLGLALYFAFEIWRVWRLGRFDWIEEE